MTYRVEQFVAKIKSPVVAVIEDKQMEFADGKAFADTSFSKLFCIKNQNTFFEMKKDEFNDITR